MPGMRPLRHSEELEHVLLGARRAYTSEELAERVGVSVETAREYWRSLGFPDAGPARVFTEADAAALGVVTELVRSGAIDERTALRLVRAIGRHAARIADWQVSTLAEIVEQNEVEGTGTGSRLTTAIRLAERIVGDFEWLLVFAWRRHLAAAANRLVGFGDREQELLSSEHAVGFADLVSYTRLSRSLDERALAALVDRFEVAVSDVVAASGARIVKTLGDEVLFVAEDPAAAVEVGLRLLEVVGAHPDMPALRVGIATGTVLARLGDVFGTPVNLAARLTSAADRNGLLVDGRTADSLSGDPRYAVVALPPRELSGFGPVTPFAVTRSHLGGAD